MHRVKGLGLHPPRGSRKGRDFQVQVIQMEKSMEDEWKHNLGLRIFGVKLWIPRLGSRVKSWLPGFRYMEAHTRPCGDGRHLFSP